MATLDVTAANAVLKEYYSSQRVEQLMYKDAPLYALMPKVKDFYGRNYPLPMRVSNPMGRSNTFSNAQGNKTTSLYKEFLLTRAADYSLASITSEAIMASETNPGAFLRLATAEIDGALESLKRSLAWALYGDGAGAIGIASAVNTTANPSVLTLKNIEDIVKFEVGQTVEARSGATPRVFATSVTSGVVSAVDRDLGKITINIDNSGGTSTVVANDTLNVVGDYNAKLKGLLAWLPSTTPSATTFFGVDRTADVTRLGGVRSTATGKPMDEAFIDAARRLGREGGSPDYGFVNFAKYATLEKTLGSRIIYDDLEVAGIAFRGIKVSGPSRPFTIMPDRDCNDAYGHLLTMDTLALYSLKEPVMILDLDGNKMLRDGSADSYEVRCASYSQVGCTFPGGNATITW